jgi:hypothetical protein
MIDSTANEIKARLAVIPWRDQCPMRYLLMRYRYIAKRSPELLTKFGAITFLKFGRGCGSLGFRCSSPEREY